MPQLRIDISYMTASSSLPRARQTRLTTSWARGKVFSPHTSDLHDQRVFLAGKRATFTCSIPHLSFQSTVNPTKIQAASGAFRPIHFVSHIRRPLPPDTSETFVSNTLVYNFINALTSDLRHLNAFFAPSCQQYSTGSHETSCWYLLNTQCTRVS